MGVSGSGVGLVTLVTVSGLGLGSAAVVPFDEGCDSAVAAPGLVEDAAGCLSRLTPVVFPEQPLIETSEIKKELPGGLAAGIVDHAMVDAHAIVFDKRNVLNVQRDCSDVVTQSAALFYLFLGK